MNPQETPPPYQEIETKQGMPAPYPTTQMPSHSSYQQQQQPVAPMGNPSASPVAQPYDPNSPAMQKPYPPFQQSQPQPVNTQPMMGSPPIHQQTMVQHVVVQQPIFQRIPIQITCHNCHQCVMTQTIRELKSDAWLWAAILCFLGGILCVWIPFVMDSNYTTKHICPVCKTYLGISAV